MEMRTDDSHHIRRMIRREMLEGQHRLRRAQILMDEGMDAPPMAAARAVATALDALNGSLSADGEHDKNALLPSPT